MLVKTERKSVRKPGETRGRKRMVTMTLTLQHCINGVRYGPGAVTVREDLAATFAEQERNAHQAETFLHQQGSAIIGAGNRLIRVPNELFSDSLNRIVSGALPGGLVTRT